MGQGDRPKSDHVAVEAMRRELDGVPIDGTIVIGEGERDEAPMLYIGEKLGLAQARTPGGRQINARFPEIDIAVDPLEGTNLCAVGAPNAMTVLAAAPRGGLLHAPDLYMEKIVVGPKSKKVVDLDAPVADNLSAIAKCLDRRIEDLVVVVLDRPRHEELIRRDPRHGRADPAHRRRRPVGRHRGGRGRHGRPRGDGHGRRAGGRADGGGDALPQRRDPRAPGGPHGRRRGALREDGHLGPEARLPLARTWRRATPSSSRPPASPTARC